MNIILFNKKEFQKDSGPRMFGRITLLYPDRRLKHIRRILRATAGDILKAGIINGPAGNVSVESISKESVDLIFTPLDNLETSVFLDNPVIVMGAVRPPVVRRLIKDLTVFDTQKIIFIGTDLSEKSYLSSHSFNDEDIKKHLVLGAEQSGKTRIPDVEKYDSLDKILKQLESEPGLDKINGLAFDNKRPAMGYTKFLSDYFSVNQTRPSYLFIGSERGWTDRERRLFAESGMPLIGMGPWILRTETAVISAVAIYHSFSQPLNT